MTKAIAAGEFIETAEYSGNMYGTRYDEFDKQFSLLHCLLVLQVCQLIVATDGLWLPKHFDLHVGRSDQLNKTRGSKRFGNQSPP